MKYGLLTVILTSIFAASGMHVVDTAYSNYQNNPNIQGVEHCQPAHEQEALEALEQVMHLPHPEDVDITLSIDSEVCGTDTPLKATITNQSRNRNSITGVMFYTHALYHGDLSNNPLGDMTEKYVGIDLDLSHGESTIRCYSVPHEVIQDMSYDDDSTYNDYRYMASPASITYGN